MIIFKKFRCLLFKYDIIKIEIKSERLVKETRESSKDK